MTESAAGRTVSVVVPVIAPLTAEIVLEPAAIAVASPVALIVATAVFEEVHVTWLVMFCVVVFEYVPVAVNCCVAPVAIDGFVGVTAIEVNVGAVPELNTTSTQ